MLDDGVKIAGGKQRVELCRHLPVVTDDGFPSPVKCRMDLEGGADFLGPIHGLNTKQTLQRRFVDASIFGVLLPPFAEFHGSADKGFDACCFWDRGNLDAR